MPKGVLIVECLMVAHLQHTQAEYAALTHVAASDSRNASVDLVTSQLRGLTLTDNEPLVAPHVLGCPEHPNPTPLVSIPALAEDLERLTLLDPFVAQGPSVSTTSHCDVSQKHRNWRTVKTLAVLHNIELCLQ